jgi:hypothetical protein
VGGHQLLLLTDRAEEAERVRTEADDAHGRHGEQPQDPGGGNRDALAHSPRRERQEGQKQPGGELHTDPGREGQGGRARSRVGARAQHQRKGEQHDQQRVVVSAADGEHEQHRVQAEEGHGDGGRAAEALGRPCRQPHGGQARQDADGLQGPQPAGEPERCGGVAGEREQGAVGRVLEGPADESEDRVATRFGREVRVRVESVQRAEAGEGEVAEDVLGDQRWAEQKDQVGQHDPRRQDPDRQRAGGQQHDQVAAADDQHQGLEAGAAEMRADPPQRPGQPSRPAAAVGGDVPRRRLCGVDRQHQQAAQQRQQPCGAEQARRGGRAGHAPGCARAAASCPERGWPGRLHEPILTAPGPAGVHGCR